METKKEIRHKIIRLRKEMDPLVWQQATNDITERVINHPRFLEETDIYCYANYNGEVGTSSIMEEAWKLGKSVWFPRIEGSKMNFYLVESKDDLQPGAYGILEPTGNHIADGEDGLLIMPGVAFDEECHTIPQCGKSLLCMLFRLSYLANRRLTRWTLSPVTRSHRMQTTAVWSPISSMGMAVLR